mmetsp:Transcript_8054/g.23821  ORF Transcript_8054/g.23821 Transcript_8054/m.23821 type:complete len:376 (-) Transcript_8054:173-1300(-)
MSYATIVLVRHVQDGQGSELIGWKNLLDATPILSVVEVVGTHPHSLCSQQGLTCFPFSGRPIARNVKVAILSFLPRLQEISRGEKHPLVRVSHRHVRVLQLPIKCRGKGFGKDGVKSVLPVHPRDVLGGVPRLVVDCCVAREVVLVPDDPHIEVARLLFADNLLHVFRFLEVGPHHPRRHPNVVLRVDEQVVLVDLGIKECTVHVDQVQPHLARLENNLDRKDVLAGGKHPGVEHVDEGYRIRHRGVDHDVDLGGTRHAQVLVRIQNLSQVGNLRKVKGGDRNQNFLAKEGVRAAAAAAFAGGGSGIQCFAHGARIGLLLRWLRHFFSRRIRRSHAESDRVSEVRVRGIVRDCDIVQDYRRRQNASKQKGRHSDS